MNFFLEELKKIVSPVYPGAKYAGRSCYIPVDTSLKIKISFANDGNTFRAIKLETINIHRGVTDTDFVVFTDNLQPSGTNKMATPYIDGEYNESHELRYNWRNRTPTPADYKILSNAVLDYINVFAQQEQPENTGDNKRQSPNRQNPMYDSITPINNAAWQSLNSKLFDLRFSEEILLRICWENQKPVAKLMPYIKLDQGYETTGVLVKMNLPEENDVESLMSHAIVSAVTQIANFVQDSIPAIDAVAIHIKRG